MRAPLLIPAIAALGTVALCGHLSTAAEARPRKAVSQAKAKAAPVASKDPSETWSLEEARQLVRMQADYYREILPAMHVRYFQDGKAPAATVLKKVFQEMYERRWPEARWLAVNGRPMNQENRPRDAWEVEASRAIRRGVPLVELVKGGTYRAIAAVPFDSGPCTRCHWGEKPTDYVGGISFKVPLTAAPVRSLRDGERE